MSYYPVPGGSYSDPPENGFHPRYDNFECHRCVEYTDTNAEQTVEQDDDFQYDEEYRENVQDFREFWSVYGHSRRPHIDGGLVCIADCGSFEDAAMIVKALAEAYEITAEPIIMGERKNV